MDIGTAIRTLRVEKGMKQIEFADKSGLSQSYLSAIEKGRKEPTLSILKQIADALSVPMPVLIFFSLNIDDIDDSKKRSFTDIEENIKGLLVDTFLNPQS